MELAYVEGATGYLALPPGGGPDHAGVVIIHEWWGLNDHVRAQADLLAAEGFVVLAADLYGGQSTRDPGQARTLMQAVEPAAAVRNLQAAVAALRARPDVRAKDVGCLGWCFGGAMSLKLALAQRDLGACVIYYGVELETDPEKLKGMPPVLGLFGQDDEHPAPEYVMAFEAALKAADVLHDVHLFHQAGHAFANPTNDQRYRPQQAAEAWRHTLDFFRRLLT